VAEDLELTYKNPFEVKMIVLHISIEDAVPYLWSEGRAVGDRLDLQRAVAAIGLDWKMLKSNTSERLAWLPSQGERPVPSSTLIQSDTDARKKIKLLPHPVVARALNVAEALALVELAQNGNVPGSGVIFGNAIFWLKQAIRLAVTLVARESFLPAVMFRNENWEARWLPVPDEETDRALENLISAMPAVCRCFALKSQMPEIPRALVAERFLATTIDAIIRSQPAETERNQNHASLHDAWLHALRSADPRIHWDKEKELRDFAKQLTDWSRPIDLAARSPFKFCFRLSEPETDGTSWQVEYLLQPKTDQTTLFSVGDLWKRTSTASKQLQKLGDFTEFMLTALGQASGLCPNVRASLKANNPKGFELDNDGALAFLRESAEALRFSGFTVLLPSWWVGKSAKKLGLKVRAKSPQMQTVTGISLDALVAFNYSASLGGEEISLQELKALARLKTSLVQVRGKWTQIDPVQLRAAVRFLEKQSDQTLSARELLSLSLGGEKFAGGLQIDTVEVDGWLNDLLEKLSGRKEFTQLAQPSAFFGTLRHYQERGYSWLAFLRQWGLGACLADDMGLGKTVQTLALIQRERAAGEQRPVLLVCPTTVVNTWRKEAGRFTPELGVLVHHGSDRQKKNAFAQAASDQAIVVSSYGLLQRDLDFLKEVDWAGVVLDEAQNIKNPETRQSKAARALKTSYRIALTGTPVENHVGDLWAIMEFLNPGLLGSQNSFKNNFHKPIQMYGSAEAAEKLKRLTAPFILRRLKTDKTIITDLPEKLEMKTYCTLTKEQASLYQAVVDEMQEKIAQAEGIDRRGLVLSILMQLKQVCNHPAQFAKDNSTLHGRSGKLARLSEMLTETRELDECTLVFTQFAEMGTLLQKYLQEQFGEAVFFLHGGTSRKQRDQMVDAFQTGKHAARIFILSLKAGGTGLTLTRANHVIHFDRWWNPAVENQATDRAFRIGQDKNVQVHKFIVAGTLEERIDEMIERKTGIANQVIGAGEQWLTELSNADLRELIQLGNEAIGD
jgi:superfamily II DNA or RNA helicase